jgi:nitroreductase
MQPVNPPKALVLQVLEAATCAPNHYRTSPWRFTVVSGRARLEMGEVMAASLLERLQDDEDEERVDAETEALLEKERGKPLRAPVIIAVACVPSSQPKVSEIEEVCAVAAAVENMLLAAEALGLGAMWRTGRPAADPRVKRFLHFPEDSQIVAFVYLGYPEITSQHERSRDPSPHVHWLDEYPN